MVFLKQCCPTLSPFGTCGDRIFFFSRNCISVGRSNKLQFLQHISLNCGDRNISVGRHCFKASLAVFVAKWLIRICAYVNRAGFSQAPKIKLNSFQPNTPILSSTHTQKKFPMFSLKQSIIFENKNSKKYIIILIENCFLFCIFSVHNLFLNSSSNSFWMMCQVVLQPVFGKLSSFVSL